MSNNQPIDLSKKASAARHEAQAQADARRRAAEKSKNWKPAK